MEKEQIQEILEDYPDKAADAFIEWGKRRVEKERVYARTFLEIKAQAMEKKLTERTIDAMVLVTDDHYNASLNEIMTEGEYKRLNEKLLSAKKMADFRTAF